VEAKKNGTKSKKKCGLFPTVKCTGVQNVFSQKNEGGDWDISNPALVY